MENNKTIIVAGCTRSGMTLMMQILHAGGYPCYGPWPAFEVPLGTIDYKKAKGKAIKIVDTNKQLVPKGEYHVIMMHRDTLQQTKSMFKFLIFLDIIKTGEFKKMGAAQILDIKKSIIDDIGKIEKWASQQKKVVHVNFEDLITSPQGTVENIQKVLGITLNEKATSCIMPRGTDCYDGILEAAFFEKKK